MYDMSARLVTSFFVFIGLAAAQAAPSVQGLPSSNSIAVTACSLCAPGLLQPVCGADGVTYATECHLACEGVALTALGCLRPLLNATES
ncbi:Kazal-type serine protease inhibitor domain, partial [Haematococcus lacustris]